MEFESPFAAQALPNEGFFYYIYPVKVYTMSNEIKCLNCGHQFEPMKTIREEVEPELRLKVKEWQKKDEEFEKRLEQEKTLSAQPWKRIYANPSHLISTTS